ncbi:hypothetical protein [Mycobacterium paraintracellulare]|uniref:hypothetical protein n=1 Tax=Mycobacterium paraintracellulare TaxID=1138383 RepID=UPI0019271345|nr:hypothetical protein [Mycobacterium paraintracellulare]BCP14837.1 hypothetical protein MINTM021_17460 [Mycobacterium paraintracellulare]
MGTSGHVHTLDYGVQVSRSGRVSQSGITAVLTGAYSRARGGYIAFLDETFQLDDSDVDRRTEFYMLSAVVVHRDDLASLRGDLRKVVGGDFWHTSDELKTPEGRARARRVAEFLGDPQGNEVGIVAIKSPVAEGMGDAARAACFRQVGRTLCAGGTPLADEGVHLMILEQRRMQRNRSYDTSIVKGLRKEGTLCRHCHMIQASPTHENLLWLPDLVSSAVRRHHLDQEGGVDLFAPLAHILQVSNCP